MKKSSVKVNEESKILAKLFEESLSKKLDAIFKKESPSLYKDLSKGLKKAICHLCPENGHRAERN